MGSSSSKTETQILNEAITKVMMTVNNTCNTVINETINIDCECPKCVIKHVTISQYVKMNVTCVMKNLQSSDVVTKIVDAIINEITKANMSILPSLGSNNDEIKNNITNIVKNIISETTNNDIYNNVALTTNIIGKEDCKDFVVSGVSIQQTGLAVISAIFTNTQWNKILTDSSTKVKSSIWDISGGLVPILIAAALIIIILIVLLLVEII